MNYLFNNFKRFFEEIDQTLEKRSETDIASEDPAGSNYFDTLEDEFGIDWKSLKSIFSSEPWISSHFVLGSPNKEVAYKMSAWEIVPDSITEKGAAIRIKPTKGGNRSYLKDGILKKDSPDQNMYYLSKNDLIKFLTTGWTPPAAPAGGDDMSAMGGMGGMA
jgi:hypothetical protein